MVGRRLLMKKNLVFFMTDQQRFDTLFADIGDQLVTPTWNALAMDGIHLARTYSSCPLCVPSRTSLATGINPLKNKMILNDLPGVLAQNHTSLHKMLHEEGYDVAHIGVNHISLDPPLKESIPFAAWEDDESYERHAREHGVSVVPDSSQRSEINEYANGEYRKKLYSNAVVRSFNNDLSLFKDVWFTTRAVEYIRKEHTKPFALFICLWAPHPPLVVPPAYRAKFDPDKVKFPPSFLKPPKNGAQGRKYGASAQLGKLTDPDIWKEAWAAHYSLTNLADEQLGRVVAALKETSLFEETLIVCTADHGEQLGEHGNYQKMEMYESAIRVPAVFRMKGLKQNRIDTPISHLDFVPTILDLLEVDVDQTFEGQSHADSFLNGEPLSPSPVFAVYNGNHALGDIRRMIVEGGWKYIWDGEEAELFDLVSDPDELVNLSGQAHLREREYDLHRQLSTWAKNQNDWIDYNRRWN